MRWLDRFCEGVKWFTNLGYPPRFFLNPSQKSSGNLSGNFYHKTQCVYDFQDLGGHAAVNARSADKIPFSNLAEFKKEFPRKYFIGSAIRYDPNYLGSIKAEDSPDGFLQLALLVLTREPFYIHQHAAYSIFDPVLNRETLEDILKDLPEKLKKRGGELDITPG